MKIIITTLGLLAYAITLMAQNTYSFDKNHGRLTFSATHFGISHVEGNFKNFDATLKSGKEDFSDADIEMIAEAKSINTDNDMRDKDLKSSNWFDADKYPSIIFKSTSFKKVNGENYKLEGNITMHGVTKPIVFDVVYNGKAMNPYTKKNSVGFTITGKLNRHDFGIGTESFEKVVGNEIELKSNAEFIIN